MISEGHPFPIESIVVNRSSRVRKEVTSESIENLKGSIARLGLINPITITREGVLIAGETRLLACKALGWDKISVRFSDETDEKENRIIELEENVKRTDLDWRDKVRAMRELHESLVAADPTWNQDKTAEHIGMSTGEVSNFLAVERNLSNEHIAKQSKFTTALNAVKRKEERAKADQTQMLMEPAQGEQPVLNEDFIKWAETYSGPKFNFGHFDFPYGIGRDKSGQGAVVSIAVGKYDDSLETYLSLLDCLEANMDKLFAESAHILFWFSMNYYQMTLDRLTKMGWRIDPYPAEWFKSDNSGMISDPQRSMRRVYETAFFGWRGDRKVIRPVSNLKDCPTSQEEGHASIKPEPMLRHFFQMIVDENTRMLDPTCGSGSSIRACEAMGGKAIGLEINETFTKRANFAIMQAREGRRK